MHGTLPNARRLPNAHRVITALQLQLKANYVAVAWAASVKHTLVAMPLNQATLCTCMNRWLLISRRDGSSRFRLPCVLVSTRKAVSQAQ